MFIYNERRNHNKLQTKKTDKIPKVSQNPEKQRNVSTD